MPKESNLELKVGSFVLVASVLMTVFLFSVTDSSVFKKGKMMRVVFEFANGLKRSAPVRVAGVDQGVVQSIKLFFDATDGKTKAEVELWLDENTKIPADSIVTINQLGLLGEKYIEIIPGLENNNFLSEGALIVGVTPIAQEAISSRVLEVANELDRTISGFNVILHEKNTINSISQTMANLNEMTNSVSVMLRDLRAGKGSVGRLLTEEELYDNFVKLTTDLKSILADLERGQGAAGHLLKDESLYNNLEELSADLKENPWKLLYRPKEKKR